MDNKITMLTLVWCIPLESFVSCKIQTRMPGSQLVQGAEHIDRTISLQSLVYALLYSFCLLAICSQSIIISTSNTELYQKRTELLYCVLVVCLCSVSILVKVEHIISTPQSLQSALVGEILYVSTRKLIFQNVCHLQHAWLYRVAALDHHNPHYLVLQCDVSSPHQYVPIWRVDKI